MTALLAFFIVLNSLATEQTGVNIYSGTGSFIRATDALGVPGIFEKNLSRNAIQLEESAPAYLVPTDSQQRGNGPDDEDDGMLVRDWELQNFERALIELDRFHHASDHEESVGEVAFDRLSPLNLSEDLLDAEMRELLRQIAPSVRSDDTQLEFIVWTPTPAISAWQRSALLATKLRSQSIEYLQLHQKRRQRVRSSSQQWSHANVQRPAVSVIVRKHAPVATQ